MKIIIGTDHGALDLKDKLSEWLKEIGHEVKDIGVFEKKSVDYPDIAKEVAINVSNEKYDKGIILCGSGIGVAISANKVKGIRAVNCHDVVSARLSREHNNANVITMGGRFIALEMAQEVLKVWLNTKFEGGRHNNRIQKISDLEK